MNSPCWLRSSPIASCSGVTRIGSSQSVTLKSSERADEAEGADDHERQQVVEKRRRLAPDQADVPREHAGEQHADDAADAVAGEHVERVVERRLRLPVHRHVADDAGGEADEDAVRDA